MVAFFNERLRLPADSYGTSDVTNPEIAKDSRGSSWVNSKFGESKSRTQKPNETLINIISKDVCRPKNFAFDV